MLGYWSQSPAFASGQMFSASGHAASLIDNTNALLAAYLNGYPPMTTVSVSAQQTDYWHHWYWGRVDGDWIRLWSGGIRHKTNSFKWAIRVVPYGGVHITVRLMYGDTAYTLINDETASDTYSGTVTLSGHTVDQLYTIHIDVDATVNPDLTTYDILYLYEAYTPTLASLVSFAAGTTPSVAEWQSIPARDNTLHDMLLAPIPCFLGGINMPLNGLDHNLIWKGTTIYISRYLYYHVRLSSPGADGPTATAVLTINGSDFTLASLAPPSYYPSPEVKGVDDYDYTSWEFRGTVDLNSLGLTVGSLYEASVSTAPNGEQPFVGKLLALWPQAQSNPTLAWWTPMLELTHGSAVNVQAIRDNLTALSSRVVYRNFPVSKRISKTSAPYWSSKSWRWLHYYCEKPEEGTEDPSPSLGFWNGFEWVESGLDYKPNEWLQFDMQSQERFWEGTPFRVKDVTYALQDINP